MAFLTGHITSFVTLSDHFIIDNIRNRVKSHIKRIEQSHSFKYNLVDIIYPSYIK